MDFSPDEGQQAVADVVTSVLERDNSWEALVAGGVSALAAPERLGGDGVGLSEIATALVEIGRHGTISPALATLGLGAAVLLELATEATALFEELEHAPDDRSKAQNIAKRFGRIADGAAKIEEQG